jgi:ribosomal protein S18 acetylase RimI-like enzyme
MEKIRRMKFKDWKVFVDIVHEEWDLGRKKSKAEGKICAWLYLFETLSTSNELIVCYNEDEIYGFAGYDNYRSNHKFIRKNIYEIVRKCLIRSKKIKDRKALYQYYETYDNLANELQDDFDGELSILIVNKKYRGKRIGQKLLEEICKRTKKKGLQNLRIETDDGCNVKFYETNNCNLKYEKMIKAKEYFQKDYKVYIFEKEL